MPKDKKISRDGIVNSSPLFYLLDICYKIFRFIFLVFMVFIIIYPILYMISMAFRTTADVYDPSIVWIPRHFTLENFKLVMEITDYTGALMNTLFLSLSCSVIELFISAFVGYGFARYKFKGKAIMLIIVIFTIVVPPQMVSLPTYLNYRDFDIMGIKTMLTGTGFGFSLLGQPLSFLINALFGMGIRSGLFILLFMQYFKGLPIELENAALVDGCGGIKTFFRIMLPNARNLIVMIFLFSFVWYWNDYYLTSIYLGAGFPTVSTKLSGLKGLLELTMHTLSYDPYQVVVMQQAFCLLVILPPLLLYVILQRKFIQGVENSGIVG
ncbi:MAG: carbohydrate ABC transporter permease [Ruminococcaceae bacterium]|nr:carbohydrate ABC transporter permease [Oscillospiraceae bacterium]